MSIPFWLICMYGLVEKILILYFISNLLNLKIDKKHYIIIASILLFINLLIRNNCSQYIVIILSSLIATIIILKIYFKATNILKIISSTIISLIILIVSEVAFTVPIFNYFRNLEEIFLWLVTGIPHLIILFISSIIVREVKCVYAKQKQTLQYY